MDPPGYENQEDIKQKDKYISRPDPSCNDEDRLRQKLQDLDTKLAAVSGGHVPCDKAGSSGYGAVHSAIGLAFRLVIELMLGPAIGGGMGWLLDRIFNTSPILFFCFFILGVVSGVINTIRTMKQVQAKITADNIKSTEQ